jgi:hypothetical protein
MTLLGLALGVVDQVDGAGALVELADGRLLEVHRSCLPAPADEGDRFVYRDLPQADCPYTLPIRRLGPAKPQGGQHES